MLNFGMFRIFSFFYKTRQIRCFQICESFLGAAAKQNRLFAFWTSKQITLFWGVFFLRVVWIQNLISRTNSNSLFVACPNSKLVCFETLVAIFSFTNKSQIRCFFSQKVNSHWFWQKRHCQLFHSAFSVFGVPSRRLHPNPWLRNRVAIGLALLARIGTSLDRVAKGLPTLGKG